MAAYLLALYYCSRDDEHAPEEAVKFALNRYISDSCKEDAQTQLQEACDESDDLGYTEEYGDGPRTLTARGLDQINAAAMQKGDYIELVHANARSWQRKLSSACKLRARTITNSRKQRQSSISGGCLFLFVEILLLNRANCR